MNRLTVSISDLVDASEGCQVGHEEEIVEQLDSTRLMRVLEDWFVRITHVGIFG